ncbi:hypothetical protein BO70DRAFT_363953 [Aspergillus heteromorphus CBS 117.55]|uniref:DUF7703 domain-containing protein n=1 Tax=Aspergillus heteromorphus CBS 117.55 TaxID=1448321 RepID=A0A317VLX8_9EURO|nr:uncharacterized protein BO70DRAFT_363953 [Aspergillus heteromorphus CBS 117.55]PWY75373.1 hypothetical protein BO70DRAFT_363953 [Aspergillus heteromorphus CBS 117.55]
MLILVFTVFKRHTGMYFWSILVSIVSTLGAIPFCVLFVWYPIKYAVVSAVGLAYVYSIISVGNSLILYSRINLVTGGRRPRWLLYLIIASVVAFQVPHLILLPAAAVTRNPRYIQPELVLGHIAVVGYCAREFVILIIFAYEATRSLRPLLYIRGTKTREVIIYLIVGGSVAFVLDTANVVLEFVVSRPITAGFILFASSLKVKVEFACLNKLIRFVHSTGRVGSSGTDTLPLDQDLTAPVGTVMVAAPKRRASSHPQSQPQPQTQRQYPETTQTQARPSPHPRPHPHSSTLPHGDDSISITSAESDSVTTPPRALTPEHASHEPDVEAAMSSSHIS